MRFSFSTDSKLNLNSKLRPKLSQVVLQLVILFFTLLSVRWFIFEPFTVPSGSMFPNLLVNDYILVNKMGSGIKLPVFNYWVLGPYLPQRGKIVVFWSVKSHVYFVKRLMGLPGDVIKMKGNQVLEINGQPVVTDLAPDIWDKIKEGFPTENDHGVTALTENYSQVSGMGVNQVTLMYPAFEDDSEIKTYVVPPKQLFFMGDHRSSSSDSRVWGFADQKDLVGPLNWVLFSCAEKNVSTQFCDLKTIRWDRVFSKP
jgi:signal peptidase I